MILVLLLSDMFFKLIKLILECPLACLKKILFHECIFESMYVNVEEYSWEYIYIHIYIYNKDFHKVWTV